MKYDDVSSGRNSFFFFFFLLKKKKPLLLFAGVYVCIYVLLNKKEGWGARQQQPKPIDRSG